MLLRQPQGKQQQGILHTSANWLKTSDSLISLA